MAVIGYVDDADFADWLASRGYSVSGDAAQLLTRSFDWVELQSYNGTKTSASQGNQWPRANAYIDGVMVDSSVVPDLVKELQMRYAYDLDSGNDAMSVRDQQKSSVSVSGAVSVTYREGSSKPTLSGQTNLILGKLTQGGGGNTFRVYRG